MLRNFCLFTLLVLLTSCGGGNTYHLKTSDAKGVKAGDKVLRQGVEVGEVTAVGFADDQVDITISTNDAMFEGQDFSFTRDEDGKRAVELDRPSSTAKELSSGATVEDRELNLDVNLGDLGDALEKGLDAFFGKDGEKIEKLGAFFEKFGTETAEELEKWGEEMEAWAKEHESEFKDLEAKLEKWSEENEGKMDEFSDELDRITEEHPIGSKEWRRELRKSIDRLDQ